MDLEDSLPRDCQGTQEVQCCLSASHSSQAHSQTAAWVWPAAWGGRGQELLFYGDTVAVGKMKGALGVGGGDGCTTA